MIFYMVVMVCSNVLKVSPSKIFTYFIRMYFSHILFPVSKSFLCKVIFVNIEFYLACKYTFKINIKDNRTTSSVFNFNIQQVFA